MLIRIKFSCIDYATATFSEWSHASANLGVQFEHCVDMFGSPISDDQNLLQLKWIIGSQQQVDLHACDLHERARILSRLPRIESCLLQGPAVATDEMFFYLQAVSSIGIAKARPPFIVDGLSDLHEDAQNWQDEASDFKEVSPSLVRYAAQWYQQDPRQEATVTAIWINHHWIPIWLVPSSSINPQEPFIAGDSRIAYRVGPFPWGTTGKAIQQLFQQWQWQARVIHTIAKAKDSSGLMWLVHSTGPPTSLVYQLEHGDVVIHQENVSPKEPWKPPQAQTSIKEFKDRAPEVDFDPWAEAARKLPRSDNMSATQLASIEANVEQKVMQRLQDHQEGNDVAMGNSLEPRVSYLEQQLASLQTKSGLIENKVDHLHQQVDQQSKKFEAALDNKLSEQMQRIEALMSKRSRAHE